jgi:predicted nucleic acid-binding protein
MILLDTSFLIDALSGSRRSAPLLRAAIERGDRMGVPTLVLYEWRRGPRTARELAAQEALFPSQEAVVFGQPEALLAAELYRQVKRPRSREIDLAIAACAITSEAELWTLNGDDFSDIPGLRVANPQLS